MTRSWPNLFLAAYVALIGGLLFATPAHSATRCRGAHGRFVKCPPPPAPAPTPTPSPAPVPVTWVAAPLTDGGYARCKTVSGCHSIAYPCPPLINTTGPIYCSYPNIIAQEGEVRLQAWNGISNENRIIETVWPVGHDPRMTKLADDWRLGVEGWQDEWEGVAPAP